MSKLTNEQYDALLDWVKDHQSHFMGFPMEFVWQDGDEDIVFDYDTYIAELKRRGETSVFEFQNWIDSVLEGELVYHEVTKNGCIRPIEARETVMRSGDVQFLNVSSLDEFAANPFALKYAELGKAALISNAESQYISLDGFGKKEEAGVSIYYHGNLKEQYREPL